MHDSPPAPVARQIKRLQLAMRAALDGRLRGAGITVSQYLVLNELRDGEARSSAELSRRCGVSPQAMTGLVGALEATGAVGRTPCAHHGRVIEVSLTPAGVEVLGRADGLVDQVEGVLLSGLTPAQQRQLPRMLDLCLTALERGLS